MAQHGVEHVDVLRCIVNDQNAGPTRSHADGAGRQVGAHIRRELSCVDRLLEVPSSRRWQALRSSFMANAVTAITGSRTSRASRSSQGGEPVHSRKLNVREDQLRTLCASERETFLGRGRLENAIPVRAENVAEQHEGHLIVLDDQDQLTQRVLRMLLPLCNGVDQLKERAAVELALLGHAINLTVQAPLALRRHRLNGEHHNRHGRSARVRANSADDVERVLPS